MDTVLPETKSEPSKRRRTQSCTKLAIHWGLTTVDMRNLCEIVDKQQNKPLPPSVQIMTKEETRVFLERNKFK